MLDLEAIRAKFPALVSGDVILDNLQGIGPGTALGANPMDQLLGISPGMLAPGGAAYDPGSAAFGPGLAGGAGGVLDALYDFNPGVSSLRHAAIAAGLNSLVFCPSPATPGNYLWFGL